MLPPSGDTRPNEIRARQDFWSHVRSNCRAVMMCRYQKRIETVTVCVVRPLGRKMTDESFIVGRDVRSRPGCDIYLSGMR